jgi:hypothetical protein
VALSPHEDAPSLEDVEMIGIVGWVRRLIRRAITRGARWAQGDTRTWRQALTLAETRIRVEREKADKEGWNPADSSKPTVRRILTGRGRDMYSIVHGKPSVKR